MNELDITLWPQFVSYSDFNYRDKSWHRVQKLFYEFDNLSEINILVAPTGTGKSFAFPLPILEGRDNKKLSPIRGMIVLPTNALIEDIERSFCENYPEVKVEKLNSAYLDSFKAKGPQRWRKILEIIDTNDLIITNPDILNFIIFGGYSHGIRGERQWSDIIEKISYFVFDEYHLYDEEQIANILCLILLRKWLFPSRETKIIFSSATPEEGLEEYLNINKIKFVKHVEEVKNEGRQIHGKIKLHFIKSNLVDFISQDQEVIRKHLEEGEKILVIFDRLKDLHEIKGRIKSKFTNYKIEEESGWTTKSNITYKNRLKEADIILGTNKLEVGVNLDVNVCFMEPGKYLRNFLQRMGRVARGEHNGEIYIFRERLKPIQKVMHHENYNYYEFLKDYSQIQSEKKFYTEEIPKYIGTFLYAIERETKSLSLRNVMKKSLKLEGESKSYYFFMKSLGNDIKSLKEINKRAGFKFTPDVKAWEMWWERFLDTFKYFRENAITCHVVDTEQGDNFETEYSLEWILKNKTILEKKRKNGEEYYIIGGNREEPAMFMYEVDSLLPIELRGSDSLLIKSEYFNLKGTFQKKLGRIYQESYQRRRDEFSLKCQEIVDKMYRQLVAIITPKRLNVVKIHENQNII